MPIIHCGRECRWNMNSNDRCELCDMQRIYLDDGMCSAFKMRPLPEPVPMINLTVVHEPVGKIWNRRQSRVRVWK